MMRRGLRIHHLPTPAKVPTIRCLENPLSRELITLAEYAAQIRRGTSRNSIFTD